MTAFLRNPGFLSWRIDTSRDSPEHFECACGAQRYPASQSSIQWHKGANKMNTENRKKTKTKFAVTLIVILIILVLSIVKTNAYNSKVHSVTLSGTDLFPTEEAETEDSSKEAAAEAVSLKAAPRGSTWTKVFDIHNEGLTEHNYQAYTYDISITNNTRDEVENFSFKMTFNKNVYLLSAWNGALEIHQNVDGKEIVSTVPDLREFKAEDHPLKTATFDGETLIDMDPGDYFVYIPSSSMNAVEIPLEAGEETTPGFILYIAIGENIDDSTIELEYKFHRLITSEPLFQISILALLVWLIALIIFEITSAQIKKYQQQHERDNEIIKESIETFTGFIDAKDPYTNGHSNRVAKYTRRIAEEMGFEGEELDRIFYIALLHDCGKIGVPDNILRKPGKLTDEEFQVIKSHTVRGGEILRSFKSLKNAGEGALYHHERYDGRGYPEGRAGQDIPFVARMICVADSFDAMNTNRVYRNKLTKEHIINEIETNKGKQFDPEIADVMLRLLREDPSLFET